MSYLYKCINNEVAKKASKHGAAKVNRTPDPVITNDVVTMQFRHFQHFIQSIKPSVCAVLAIPSRYNLCKCINNYLVVTLLCATLTSCAENIPHDASVVRFRHNNQELWDGHLILDGMSEEEFRGVIKGEK